MSDLMKPISFEKILKDTLKEYKESGSFYYVPVEKERVESPIGPAAGPHTQLTQNILAAYAAGAHHFELKTVQILVGEQLGIVKPCIYVKGEAYNTEWSTELTVKEALEEYIKAWILIHLFSKEFSLNDADKVVFYVSVGYNLEGIQSETVDSFINHMKKAGETEIWKECMSFCENNLNLFEHISKEDLEAIPSDICKVITLSTMHGCPPQEIEKIAVYLLTEKDLNIYIKCNPTLVGYEKSLEILKGLGYGYVTLSKEVFEHDITYPELIALIHRMRVLAAERGRTFGVKLTNTFPVKIVQNELAGTDMYMSGPPLYPFAINVAAMMSKEFDGMLPISYSGGADLHNIQDILDTGIYPVTVSTLLLKQGGYKNIGRLHKACKANIPYRYDKVDPDKVAILAEKAITDVNYAKESAKQKTLDAADYSALCAKCRNCVDVCPNRSNKTVIVDGTKINIHLDDLCNECGNCQHFCIYGKVPYKDKFTIFSSEEAFYDSENPGVYAGDELLVRGNGVEYAEKLCKMLAEQL